MIGHTRAWPISACGWALLIALVALTSWASVRADSDIETEVERIDATLREQEFRGSVLIAQGDQILLDQGYGMTNIESGIPNTPETIFPIASITKPFTAMVILQLHEQGLLELDDPVARFLPDFPDGDRITIHHLLTHTSGLHRDIPGRTAISYGATVTEALATYRAPQLVFEPGSRFAYSNLGYYILSHVIEDLTGTSFEDYLQNIVFEPLGMNSSGVAVEPLIGQDVATGYLDRGGTVIPATPVHASWWKGGGGIFATTHDLYRWERALNAGELLSLQSRERMFSQQDDSGYGYGWYVIEPDLAVWHSGALSGYRTLLFRDIDRDLVVIGLSNSESIEPLTDTFLRAHYPSPGPMERSTPTNGLLTSLPAMLLGASALWLIVALWRRHIGTP